MIPATEKLLFELAMLAPMTALFELTRMHGSLQEWARTRMSGLSWVLVDQQPVVAGGVFDDGYVWLLGAKGWGRRLKTVLRIWREIRASGAYPLLYCECMADNEPALRLAKRAGFVPFADNGCLIECRVPK